MPARDLGIHAGIDWPVVRIKHHNIDSFPQNWAKLKVRSDYSVNLLGPATECCCVVKIGLKFKTFEASLPHCVFAADCD